MTTPALSPELQTALESVKALAAETPPPAPMKSKLADEKVAGRSTNSDLLRRILNDEDLGDCIPEDMHRAYARAVLTGIPFTHTFSLYEGKVMVTFAEPSAEGAMVHGRLSLRMARGDVEGINALSMLFFLREVSFPEDKRPPVKVTPLAWNPAWEEMTTEQLSLHLQQTMATSMGSLGGSLLRMLPSLWIMYSGAWRYLIQQSLPSSF